MERLFTMEIKSSIKPIMPNPAVTSMIAMPSRLPLTNSNAASIKLSIIMMPPIVGVPLFFA
jgi:hypothetical protein